LPDASAAGSGERQLRCLVVDDEPLARSNLTVLLRRDPDVEIVGECASGIEALSAIRAQRPDLVFLDVEMPECDGFDVLELLGADAPAGIVFVTAFDRYAIRAFEAGALDYLLKPFDDARFARALERAKERVESARRAPVRRSTLVVKSAGSTVFVDVAAIDWIESADYYSRLHAGGATHLLRRSMAELERELDPALFCRIHRTAIVRLARVQRLDVNESGDYDVVLLDGTRIPLSRRNRKDVLARLGAAGL
jgi:two-component system, LytTR family, response regulator